MLDRQRLRRIGTGLGSQYVLLPGLAQFDEEILDKFEAAGLKLVRNRVTTLRLWLQLWDSRTGHIVWESSGEVTTSTVFLSPGKPLTLEQTAKKLLVRMIQDGLLDSKRETQLYRRIIELAQAPPRDRADHARAAPPEVLGFRKALQVRWRLHHQTSDAGHERQQEYRGRHEVEHAINFKALPLNSHRSAGPAPSRVRSPG